LCPRSTPLVGAITRRHGRDLAHSSSTMLSGSISSLTPGPSAVRSMTSRSPNLAVRSSAGTSCGRSVELNTGASHCSGTGRVSGPDRCSALLCGSARFHKLQPVRKHGAPTRTGVSYRLEQEERRVAVPIDVGPVIDADGR